MAGKREKGADTELSHELLDCVAGVCIVKIDVIPMVCQTLLQTLSQRKKHLCWVHCCSCSGSMQLS